jgi:hypothetical protein
VQIVIDDTLAPKKGAHVYGIGSHVDAVRSTKKHRAFSFGHCWVVLSVLVRVPFSRVELAADSAYCNDTVTRGLATNVILFGAMRPDAVLTSLPPDKTVGASGRPNKRGKVLPKPLAIAKDKRHPWLTCTAMLYGRKTKVQYKTVCAQWYRACGVGLLRIVIVATDHGAVPFRVFFCADATVDVVRLLETYSGRWGIEVFFKDAKQLLGFADSSARKPAAVLRVAPFVGLLYTALVVWFLEGAHQSPLAIPPLRPWYRHKRALVNLDILDQANDIQHLPKPVARSRIPDKPARRHAA